MKLNWSKERTFGMLIGIIWPLLFLPVVLYILSLVNNFTFSELWNQVLTYHQMRSKYLSLSLISNIGWFYFFLNREEFDYTYGIIFGMLITYVPYMVYVNLILF